MTADGTTEAHPLHAADRTWTETNCYIDVWIELLNHLGLDPVPAAVCTLSADFLGDQWTFLKFAPEDLRTLYGIDVAEMNIWRPVRDHVVEQINAGRLTTVEVDSWWLPDTAGVSYRLDHVKTTIIPLMVDVEAGRMRYLHSAGTHELAGEDFARIFDMRLSEGAPLLPPYVEMLRLDGSARRADLADVTAMLAHQHIERRPADNPVRRLGDRLRADLPWLKDAGMETFHQYAFGMIRQFGVTAELAGDLTAWLTLHNQADLARAAEDFRASARAAKTLQFQLARAVAGRSVDVDGLLDAVAEPWGSATDAVVRWHDG